MLPFEIRAIVPSYFNDYAVRRDFPLTAFSTCTPLCRRAKICLYLRHRAFRSEQSRHCCRRVLSECWSLQKKQYGAIELLVGQPSPFDKLQQFRQLMFFRKSKKNDSFRNRSSCFLIGHFSRKN